MSDLSWSVWKRGTSQVGRVSIVYDPKHDDINIQIT